MTCCGICIGSSVLSTSKKSKKSARESYEDLAKLEEFKKENFDFKEELGKGGFGTVHRVVEKATGLEMACKIIECTEYEEEDFENLCSELTILQRIEYKGLPKVYGVYGWENCVVVNMELLLGGHLYTRMKIDGEAKMLTEVEVVRYVKQICETLMFIHNQGIVHCDLKPDNIALVSEDSDEIKILDFGLSQIRQTNGRCFKLQGTPKYIAPEALGKRGYTETFDMWSLGVITFEMLHGYTPFACKKKKKLTQVNPQYILMRAARGFQNVTRRGRGPHFNDKIDISDNAKDFIVHLIMKDQTKRLTAKEALLHPWMDEHLADTHHLLSAVPGKLHEYQKLNKIQSCIMPFMLEEVKKLNAFLLDKLKKTFEEIDEDGSGELDFDEFVKVLKCTGQVDDKDEKELLAMFSAIDVDGSGEINHDEFLEWFAWEHIANQDARFWAFIESFDQDRKGFVTLDDIKEKIKNNPDTCKLLDTPAMKGFEELYKDNPQGIDIHELAMLIKNADDDEGDSFDVDGEYANLVKKKSERASSNAKDNANANEGELSKKEKLQRRVTIKTKLKSTFTQMY